MEITLQWLVGFVDGEGCVAISSSNRSTGRYATPYLQITNTHLPTLKLIKQQFGGSLYSLKKSKQTRLQAYFIRWNSKKAIALLEQLYPYLVTKKDQVGVLLAAWKPQRNCNRLSLEEHARRAQLISKLQEMKRINYPATEELN